MTNKPEPPECPECGSDRPSLVNSIPKRIRAGDPPARFCKNPWHDAPAPTPEPRPELGYCDFTPDSPNVAHPKDVNCVNWRKAGTPKPRTSDECIVCGATLLPIETPPHCEDCIVTDEHYEKWAGTPETPPKGQMEYDKWSDKAFVNRYEKSLAGTPETPSGPPCPCGYDASLGTMVEEAAHRSDCPKVKRETPSAPDEMTRRAKIAKEQGFVAAMTGETPSALSDAPTELEFLEEWREKTGNLDYLDDPQTIELMKAYAATLREEIEDLRGMVRDERALRKGQLEEVEGKLATAQQTIEDLQDCASLEGNAKATERALEAEKKLATAERERDALNETVEMLLRYRKAAEAELAREREFREGYANKLASTQIELARVKEALQAAFDYLPDDYYGPDPDGDDRLNALNRKIAAALRPGGEKPSDKLNSKEKA